jgi:RNA polymerase sigma factor (sigma-70 family)
MEASKRDKVIAKMSATQTNEFLPTRQSLLSRLRNAGDDQGWREFFETYWKLIYSFAIRKGLNEQEAQEVVQETCIAVAKTMPEFDYNPARCSFKSWLRHLAEKKIADQFRKRERAGVLVSADDTAFLHLVEASPSAESIAPDSQWDEEWQKHLLAVALERVKTQVSPRQFKLFHHHAVQGQSVKDTARAFGVSLMQVYLARHRVGKLVQREVARLREKPV